jgi:hypothetical protein
MQCNSTICTSCWGVDGSACSHITHSARSTIPRNVCSGEPTPQHVATPTMLNREWTLAREVGRFLREVPARPDVTRSDAHIHSRSKHRRTPVNSAMSGCNPPTVTSTNHTWARKRVHGCTDFTHTMQRPHIATSWENLHLSP